MLIHDRDAPAGGLADALREWGSTVTTCELGTPWRADGADRFVVPPTESGYQRMLGELDGAVSDIVYVGARTPPGEVVDPAHVGEHLDRGVHSLFELARALATHGVNLQRLTVVAPWLRP